MFDELSFVSVPETDAATYLELDLDVLEAKEALARGATLSHAAIAASDAVFKQMRVSSWRYLWNRYGGPSKNKAASEARRALVDYENHLTWIAYALDGEIGRLDQVMRASSADELPKGVEG